MGFLARCKNLWRPRRQYGTGGLWDNINTPGSKHFLAPTTPNNSTQGQDNHFTPGPRLQFYSQSGYSASPYREHSQADILQPVIPVRNPVIKAAKQSSPPRTRIRELEWDAGNSAVLRKPDLASQQYFNQKVALPEFTTPAVFAHQVQCNIYPGQSGWEQAYVAEPGMRQNEVGHSPPTLLSRPIHSKTITGSVSGHRATIKKVKAPTRKRSGG